MNLRTGRGTGRPLPHYSHTSGHRRCDSESVGRGTGMAIQITKPQFSNTTTPNRILHYHSPRLLRTPVAVIKQRQPLSQLAQPTKNLFKAKCKHESATPVSPLIRKTRQAGTPTFHRLTSANHQPITI
jgi:hypothetical protein